MLKSSDINQTQSYFVDAAIEDVAKNIAKKQNISFEQAKKDIYTMLLQLDVNMNLLFITHLKAFYRLFICDII